MTGFYFAETKRITGEVVSVLTMGTSKLEEAQKLMGEGMVAVSMSGGDFEAAASGCAMYYDVVRLRFVNAGREPFDGAEYNFARREWVDRRNIEELKQSHWSMMKAHRQEEENTGYKWRGIPIDSDVSSRTVIFGALEMARLVPGFSIDFTAGDNSEVVLGETELREILVGIAAHVDAVHRKGRAVRAKIAAATDNDEVLSIMWGD